MKLTRTKSIAGALVSISLIMPLVAGDLSPLENPLTAAELRTAFGGAANPPNGLCCAVKAACRGAGLTNCTGHNPCSGTIGPNVFSARAIFCGVAPNPANPAASCGQFVNDPLGNSYICFQKVNCVPDGAGGCQSGSAVAGSQVPGVFFCMSNPQCPAGPIPAPGPVNPPSSP
jgi:hypothetical protein